MLSAVLKAILRPGDRVLESDAQGLGELGELGAIQKPCSIGDFVASLV